MPLELPYPLIEAIKNGKATLFLGAGASREADYPGSQDIANYLAEESGDEFKEKLIGRSLDEIAEYLYQKSGYGERWVRDKLISLFTKLEGNVKNPPSNAHKLLSKIKWRRIYTTNYDTLVEKTYIGSSEKVQQLLPIVEYNLELERNNEDTLQFIKLNGCVKEAERNYKHKLVLTFSDQQKARKKNNELYGFLEKDALLGPIIFIGFSFTHPGTKFKGSSPEFEILNQMLKEIGPASQFHYSVSPFDELSFDNEILISKLKGSNVECINATFGEFLKQVFSKTRRTSPIDNRPPIPIRIGLSKIEIPADVYVKDKEFFDTLGPHLWEYMPPSVEKSLNGHETWPSFYYNHFIRRQCHDEFISLLNDKERQLPEIITFAADIGWGKTFFLKQICCDLVSKGRPIIWLKPEGTLIIDRKGTKTLVGSWDYTRIDRLIGQINNKIKDTRQNMRSYAPIIIADNMPDRIEEIINLFKYLNLYERKYLLIISFRLNEFKYILEEYPIIKKGQYYEPDNRNINIEIKKLIEHCQRHKIGLIESDTHKEIIENTIYESGADSALILALHIIYDKQHRPFNKIIKDIYDGLDNKSQNVLLYVSSLNRHGGIFYPRLYSLLRSFPDIEYFNTIDIYNNSLSRNILFEEYHNQEPCVRTLHPLVAEEFTKVSGLEKYEIDIILSSLISNMTKNNIWDINIIRSILRGINDYSINISSEEIIEELYNSSISVTDKDWVVCQQYSKYLLNREQYERALYWIEQSLLKNPTHPTLLHHKGNVLRRWGMKYRNDGYIDKSDDKFNEAKILFSMSRLGTEPNEYGYVTHLDMLRYLIKNASSEEKSSGYRAEGYDILQKGLLNIPVNGYNLLLDERFNIFKLTKQDKKNIAEKIENALYQGQSSIYATIYLTDYYYFTLSDSKKALEILNKYREINDKGILTWLKEARFYADMGDFTQAFRALHSAKLRETEAEDREAIWTLTYLDLIFSLINEDYKQARDAIIRLIEGKFYPKRTLPRGYIWKESARSIPLNARNLVEHSIIYTGRVVERRSNYGQILLENITGGQVKIDFYPPSFGRSVNRDDFVKFTIQIFNWGVRAESLNSSPGLRTFDHFYVPDKKPNRGLDEIKKETKEKMSLKHKKRPQKEGLFFRDKVEWKKR